MKLSTIAIVSLATAFMAGGAYAQGASEYAPGKMPGTAKENAPGQLKPEGESAKQYAPGQKAQEDEKIGRSASEKPLPQNKPGKNK